ncbi:MAG TPA: protein phosphatase CheZ [Steroidobacteraceae bacterium]|nr:protein phosphatase CheZ [Steroidobacteraceae bacterium]
MSDAASLQSLYGARLAALLAALERGDDAAFLATLDEVLNMRRPELFGELRDVTVNLKVALDRFRLDARLADFAEKEMPDARQRLAHVIKMTDEAAHRTLDLVEQSGPPAERTSRAAASLTTAWKRFRMRQIETREFHELLKRMDAFLPAAHADADAIRRNLSELLLAQGYQDLTGQILRGVIALVHELESVLIELTRLSGADLAPSRAPGARATHGEGPVVPGVTQGEVAAGQQDVDALLSGLGI